jgi:FlaA1/EpsC-like NDP-sugar epimerase
MGSLLAGVFLAGALYLSYRDVSRVLFLAFILLAFLSLTLWRLSARLLFRLSKGKALIQHKVLIIGAGPVGMGFKNKINSHSYLGWSVSGF